VAAVEASGAGRALVAQSGRGPQTTVRSHRGEPSAVSWTVAALDAERRVTSTLSRLALAAHRDIWPTGLGDPQTSEEETAVAHTSLRRGVDASAPVDEALAWLAQDLQLSDAELDSLGDAISYPTRSLTRTAIVLAKRLVETADSEGDRAAFLLSLGARHSELGEWAEASGHTQVAIATLRALAERDRPTYLPDLASAVGNLATCLTNLGEDHRALAAAYEAVALQRELTDADRDRHLPALARALVTLSACLSRSDRVAAAAGVAGEAVAIYRELVQLHPEAYAAELAAADHNWRVCHDAMAPAGSA
jgi:tetratricopeptide (TPR) repeat protein